jgi:hypothetical protein
VTWTPSNLKEVTRLMASPSSVRSLVIGPIYISSVFRRRRSWYPVLSAGPQVVDHELLAAGQYIVDCCVTDELVIQAGCSQSIDQED